MQNGGAQTHLQYMYIWAEVYNLLYISELRIGR